jgi:exopolysaccharide biosynthesis polyprenyl glycosylphosphotransferase
VTTSAPGRPVPAQLPLVPEGPAHDTTGVPRSPRNRPTTRLQTWARSYRVLLFGLDLVSCASAGLWAVDHYPQLKFAKIPQELLIWIALVGLPLVWALVLWGHGAYEARYLGMGPDEFKRVLKAGITLTAVICFVAFTQKLDLSRKAVGVAIPLALALSLGLRFLARKGLHYARRRGKAAQKLVLVGTLGETLSVYRTASRNPHAGLIPVAICLTESTSETPSLPIPVENGKTDVIERAHELGADTIAVCGSRGVGSDSLRRLAWQLEGTGIDLVVAPSLTDIAGPRVHIRPVEGLPLLHVEEPTVAGLGWLAKGVLDRAAALFGLLVLSPLLIGTALIIRLTSDGPVFFRQARTGRGGETIRVWKFRTMFVDAEERLASLLGSNETDGLLFKMKDDPRITPVGHWLRRLSIDELPQLINVAMGEMSLVGPRPLPVRDEEFLGDVRRRLLVRPGITGLWQVSGRSNLSWEDAVRLDLYYVDNWSLMFDVMILWKTLGAVLQRDGAF